MTEVFKDLAVIGARDKETDDHDVLEKIARVRKDMASARIPSSHIVRLGNGSFTKRCKPECCCVPQVASSIKATNERAKARMKTKPLI